MDGIIPTLLIIFNRGANFGRGQQACIIVAIEVLGEIREPVQCSVELEVCSVRLESLDFAKEIGWQVLRANEMQKCAFGIRIRDNYLAPNFCAIYQAHPGYPTLFDEHAFDHHPRLDGGPV